MEKQTRADFVWEMRHRLLPLSKEYRGLGEVVNQVMSARSVEEARLVHANLSDDDAIKLSKYCSALIREEREASESVDVRAAVEAAYREFESRGKDKPPKPPRPPFIDRNLKAAKRLLQFFWWAGQIGAAVGGWENILELFGLKCQPAQSLQT